MAGISWDEFVTRIDRMIKGLPQRVGEINELLAESAIPDIIIRLTDLGIDGSGKKLGSYSTNPLPTFFFLGKATGSDADDKLKETIKKKRKTEGKSFKGISYKEFREINNLPTNFVTLSFTGDTLSDLAVIQKEVQKNNVIITIGAAGKKTKATYNAKGEKKGEISTADVLDYLAGMYGEEILGMTKQEEEKLANAFDEEMQNYFDETIGI